MENNMQHEMELGLRMSMLETYSNLGRSMAWQAPWGFVAAGDSEVSQKRWCHCGGRRNRVNVCKRNASPDSINTSSPGLLIKQSSMARVKDRSTGIAESWFLHTCFMGSPSTPLYTNPPNSIKGGTSKGGGGGGSIEGGSRGTHDCFGGLKNRALRILKSKL